jgi:hypothetical protein
MTPAFALIAHLVAAQTDAQVAPEGRRNVVSESTEHPIVTFVTDDGRARLQRVEMSPSEHAGLTRHKQGGLWILTAASDDVCSAPCERQLSNADLYAVSGPGITRSKFFVLPRAERVTVTARTGSSPVYVLGAAMVVLGALALIPAIGLTAGESTRGLGLATLGGSLGLLGGGVYASYRASTFVDLTKDEGSKR